MKGCQLSFLRLEPLELSPQFVHEERPDDLLNVLFAGVVRAQVPARVGVHDPLKQRAKNSWADAAPIQFAASQQDFPHAPVKTRLLQVFCEQPSIDIGERGDLLVQVF